MAEEKGLIALNHCNNIANTIINKLGGTGYKPSEWRGKVNLLGISSADKSAVLAGLTPEASGEEAGLIDIETISGLAEELNEKYTTIRGFKPSEMRGAISAMIPLEEKTASGSIAHYADGAKNTPLTKCEVTLVPSVAGRNPASVSGSIVSFSDSAEVGLKACKVTIPASLAGVSSVNVERTGKNLILLYTRASNNGVSYSINSDGSLHREGTATGSSYNNGNVANYADCPYKLKAGTYTITVSGRITDQGYVSLGMRNKNNELLSDAKVFGNTSVTFTVAEDFGAWYWISLTNGTTVNEDVYIWLQAGDTSSAYEPYEAPKTYAAALGRTVYGGEIDFVNGSGAVNYSLPTLLSSLTWNKTTIGGFDCFYANLPDGYIGASGIIGICDSYDVTTDGQMGTDKTIRFYNSTSFNFSRVSIRDDQYASYTGAQFKQAVTGNIVYQLAESAQTAFTFSRVPIVPKAGANTMWSAGDILVDYYKDGYGYEEVKVYHQGANFIDDTLNGIEQGTISGSTGRNVAGTNRVRNAGYIRFPLDKIQANYTLTIPEGYKLAIRFYTEDKAFVTPPSWAQGFINQIPAAYVGQNVQFARFILAKTDDSDITPEDIANAGFILNYGSAADTYEPYTEPEEKTKDLGGIVYGGSYDFVAGETEVTYKRADLGALTWVKFPTAGYADLYYTDDLKEEIGATSGSQTHGLCYEFDVVTNDGHDGSDSSATPQPYNSIRFRASDGRIYLKVAGYTTAADMKAGVAGVMLLYQLHEPEAIESEPEAIKSYFGVNTLWNEENDTTVGYYADIDLSSNTQNALNMVNLSQEEIE